MKKQWAEKKNMLEFSTLGVWQYQITLNLVIQAYEWKKQQNVQCILCEWKIPVTAKEVCFIKKFHISILSGISMKSL